MVKRSAAPRRLSVLVWLLALILTASLTAACGLFDTDPGENGDPANGDVASMLLHFPDADAQQPVPELRDVGAVEAVTADLVVVSLLVGPDDEFLHPAFPDGTESRAEVTVDDGTAVVDLSAEASELEGATAERMAVLSLVYSLTELEAVERVQILIDGETRETLAGSVAINEPIERGDIRVETIFIDSERAAWLQEEVEAGRQEWRLNPDEVVRMESRMLGFTGAEAFDVLETDDVDALYRVTVNDTVYQLELIQPAVRGEGGIWMLIAVDIID